MKYNISYIEYIFSIMKYILLTYRVLFSKLLPKITPINLP